MGEGSNHTLFENILVTYRVNSGTAFYVGYDDRFKEASAINPILFSDPSYIADESRHLHEDPVPVQERRRRRRQLDTTGYNCASAVLASPGSHAHD